MTVSNDEELQLFQQAWNHSAFSLSLSPQEAVFSNNTVPSPRVEIPLAFCSNIGGASDECTIATPPPGANVSFDQVIPNLNDRPARPSHCRTSYLPSWILVHLHLLTTTTTTTKNILPRPPPPTFSGASFCSLFCLTGRSYQWVLQTCVWRPTRPGDSYGAELPQRVS